MRDGQPTKILKIFSQRRIIFVQNSKDKNRLGVCFYSKPLCLRIPAADQVHSTGDRQYEMVLLVTYPRMWKAQAFQKWVSLSWRVQWVSAKLCVMKIEMSPQVCEIIPMSGPAGPSKHLESTGMSLLKPHPLELWLQWERAGEHCAHLPCSIALCPPPPELPIKTEVGFHMTGTRRGENHTDLAQKGVRDAPFHCIF